MLPCWLIPPETVKQHTDVFSWSSPCQFPCRLIFSSRPRLFLYLTVFWGRARQQQALDKYDISNSSNSSYMVTNEPSGNISFRMFSILLSLLTEKPLSTETWLSNSKTSVRRKKLCKRKSMRQVTYSVSQQIVSVRIFSAIWCTTLLGFRVAHPPRIQESKIYYEGVNQWWYL